MTNKSEVVEATVVENGSAPVTQKTPIQVVNEQQVNLRTQLEQAKNNMTKLQQQFDTQKNHAIKLEGALEAGELLLKTFSK